MPRRTRKQIVGKREDHERSEREAQMRELGDELGREHELNDAFSGLKQRRRAADAEDKQ
ncbi:hypothetical protein [Glycomyces harbinensis]|uniref:Uncharacterized protein n=1 Tax=Glycomyces harbinensis TaxID=58114 RepID=A0A1G7BKU6_9ACTN|nr:hypothetical protein [Glycomyces harbinensis]SDE27542.1 hypothetical protein SAMN05216270_11714 [Glycomyces harbinensis]